MWFAGVRLLAFATVHWKTSLCKVLRIYAAMAASPRRANCGNIAMTIGEVCGAHGSRITSTSMPARRALSTNSSMSLAKTSPPHRLMYEDWRAGE